jgi:IPT/TIG domain-containing protein
MSKNEPVANSYSVNTKCCGPEILTLMEENKMIRKGLIYLTTTLMILLLVSLAMAVIPPPPANQEIGLYDTVFTGFTTEECKECHTPPLAERHHALIYNEDYNCLDCHSITNGVFDPFRECSDCHDESPHHVTDDALNYDCSECHGSFVDDYEDGHIIPTYAISPITPDTSYDFINGTGSKIGGCEACHEPDLSADPEIRSNPDTHHNLSGFTVDNCDLCHSSDSSTGTPGQGDVGLNIRYCERCHGIKSLHNIQYDYPNTQGELGKGHIGDNWDCLGCHGYPALYSQSSLDDLVQLNVASLASSGGSATGPIIITPTIHNVSPSTITAGEDTAITIIGSNFINEYNGTNYTSNVVLDNDLLKEPVVIEPDYINTTQIVATINGTLEPGNYDLWVVKEDMRSNKKSLTVSPEEPLFIIVHRKIV